MPTSESLTWPGPFNSRWFRRHFHDRLGHLYCDALAGYEALVVEFRSAAAELLEDALRADAEGCYAVQGLYVTMSVTAGLKRLARELVRGQEVNVEARLKEIRAETIDRIKNRRGSAGR